MTGFGHWSLVLRHWLQQRMLHGAALLVAVWCGQCAAAAEPAGSITGTIEPADRVRAVQLVDRAHGKKFPVACDKATGHFHADALPLAARYDLIVDYGSARLEGVDLSVPPSDYEEEQPLADDDVATIKAEVAALNKFEDIVEVLDVEGNIQHAAVLVHKLRTKPFVNSKPGEIVWRVELYHFERPDETWLKAQDELFLTLYRERIPRRAFDEKSLTFAPGLGGLRPTAEAPHLELKPITLPPAEPGVRLLSAPQESSP